MAKVLVVNDDRFKRRMMRAYIVEDLGYEFLEARDGKEGLEIYIAHRAEIGLVITDLQMPGADGFELIQEIRGLDAKLPILVDSALPHYKRMAAIELGASDDLSGRGYTHVLEMISKYLEA